MACSFPRCECMYHPDDCIFKSKLIRSIDPRKGNKMNDNLKSLEDLTPFMADETAKLSDEQLDTLLAGKDIGYVITDDEGIACEAKEAPTLH